LLTHDVQTLPGFAFERVIAKLPMAGVIAVRQGLSIGKAIDDIFLVLMASASDEWQDQVIYLPL
jgi:hypothetical protein